MLTDEQLKLLSISDVERIMRYLTASLLSSRSWVRFLGRAKYYYVFRFRILSRGTKSGLCPVCENRPLIARNNITGGKFEV